MNKITLYQFEDVTIKISMKMYFNDKNQLIFEGHDIGKKVKALKGASDYEYYYTINFEEVKKIAVLLEVKEEDKAALLQEIKKRFSGNHAYSKFGKFMEKNAIVFEQFTWR
ncbi:MAG: hypothetical protein ACRBFS_10650 [Aureispira sp.]